jgi:hypothetical protein
MEKTDACVNKVFLSIVWGSSTARHDGILQCRPALMAIHHVHAIRTLQLRRHMSWSREVQVRRQVS